MRSTAKFEAGRRERELPAEALNAEALPPGVDFPEVAPALHEEARLLAEPLRPVAVRLLAAGPFPAAGTGRRTRGPGGAAFDPAGYWVSIVGEDWRWRAFPTKGDFGAVPVSPAARQAANSWDPARDAAAGEACKAFAAPSVMRIPGRLHITWQDDQTLKIETDAGKQTRLFHLGNPPEKVPDYQGSSKAEWDQGNSGAGGLFAGRGGAASGPSGSLKVVTTKMKPGYATANGVPFSNNAILTEYFDLVKEKSGVEYLILTSVLDDPANLSQPMWTSTHFKKQADATGFKPVGCDGK